MERLSANTAWQGSIPLFWKDKKVLITGHTGFKGSWLSIWLDMLGAKVCGYALTPPTHPSLFDLACIDAKITSVIGNVSDLTHLQDTLKTFSPDIIFHLAAQSLVRPSYLDPVETYATNVMGTVHLLEAARHCSSVKVIQIITSDKCYENPEDNKPRLETDPFGGKDPYSNSKGCAELVTQAYRASFFSAADSPSISSARAGNVIGGGDWATDRLIPDCLRYIQKGIAIPIRSPKATRPWQLVLEPLSGYLWLAQLQWEKPDKYREGFNFGPRPDNIIPVYHMVEKFHQAYGKGSITVDTTGNTMPEAITLSLDTQKAKTQLDWEAVYDIDQTIEKTAHWYKNCAHASAEQIYQTCQQQIAEYIQDAARQELRWAKSMISDISQHFVDL